MRAHILDTYYGEGILDTQAADYPGFDGLYFKICEGSYGYMEAGKTIGNVTKQIASCAKDFKTVGIYHYPRRNDYVSWRKQAEAYLRQCDLLDKAGVTVDYDVQDVERANIVDNQGMFPAAHGQTLFEIYRYIYERTQRPFFIYSDPYSYKECFQYYGYTWQDELPWIVAQFPFRAWREGLDEEVINAHRHPNTYPQTRKWVMWQYSDKYPAGDWMPDSSAADVNVWKGDIEDMLKYFNKAEEPPKGCLGVIADWLRLRGKQ